jgi:hypothetical protein
MWEGTRESLTNWLDVLSSRGIWRRGIAIGGVAGSLQVAVNQGDLWWRGAVDGRVIMKSIASPTIALLLAVIAAAWTEVSQRQGKIAQHSLPKTVESARPAATSSWTEGIGTEVSS